MKIDMLSMIANLTSSQETKKEQSNVDFLKVFTTELTETSTDENIKNLLEEESEIEDELMAAIVAIINKMLSEEVTVEKGSEVDLAKVNELIKGMQGSEAVGGEDLKALFDKGKIFDLYDGKQIDDLLKKINADEGMLQNLDKDGIKEILIKLLNRTAEKQGIKNNVLTQNEVGIQENHSNENTNTDNLVALEKVINKLENQEDKLFSVGVLKHRNIIVEEKPTNTQGEFNLLNRIAFSSENFAEGTREVAPVVVRNEFLGPDMLKVVKYLSNNQVQELNVKITPKELGEVTIKLLKAEESNELIITLTNKKAYELIKENVADIEKHLANLDIKIKEIVVQVKNEVFNDFSGSFNDQFNKKGTREEQKKSFNNNESFEEEEKPQAGEDTKLNLLV